LKRNLDVWIWSSRVQTYRKKGELSAYRWYLKPENEYE
jgi:hypothetical protein